MKINKKVLLSALSVFVFFFASSISVQAAIQSLNGRTGQNQIFTNDTNVKITSAGTTHTLGWNGFLSPTRGGLGVNASTWATGSIPFFNGSAFGSFGKWDGTTLDIDTGVIRTKGLTVHSSYTDLAIDLTNLKLIDNGVAGNGIVSINWNSRTLNDANGAFAFGWGGANQFYFGPLYNLLDSTGITAARTYSFPDASGTFPLLQSSQTFSGINTFSGNNVFSGDNNFSGVNTFSNPVTNFTNTSNSTVHIGADGFPGCIVMGDDDSSGVTYITVNDGAMNVTTTKPSNCN